MWSKLDNKCLKFSDVREQKQLCCPNKSCEVPLTIQKDFPTVSCDKCGFEGSVELVKARSERVTEYYAKCGEKTFVINADLIPGNTNGRQFLLSHKFTIVEEGGKVTSIKEGAMCDN